MNRPPANTCELTFSLAAGDEIHLMAALIQYRETCRRQRVECPPTIDRIVGSMSLRVTKGQAGSTFDTRLPSADSEDMDSPLVTYGTAAGMLACSLSTVKRRVRQGVLEPVRTGGTTVRLRRADIDNLIENGGL